MYLFQSFPKSKQQQKTTTKNKNKNKKITVQEVATQEKCVKYTFVVGRDGCKRWQHNKKYIKNLFFLREMAAKKKTVLLSVNTANVRVFVLMTSVSLQTKFLLQ